MFTRYLKTFAVCLLKLALCIYLSILAHAALYAIHPLAPVSVLMLLVAGFLSYLQVSAQAKTSKQDAALVAYQIRMKEELEARLEVRQLSAYSEDDPDPTEPDVKTWS